MLAARASCHHHPYDTRYPAHHAESPLCTSLNPHPCPGTTDEVLKAIALRQNSERLTPARMSLAGEAAIRRTLKDLLRKRDVSKPKPSRQRLPEHLPRETVTLLYGLRHPASPLHNVVSEKLAYVPAWFMVKRTVRPQQSCEVCDNVHSAELTATLIDMSTSDTSLVVQVVVLRCRTTCRCNDNKRYMRVRGSTLGD